LQHTKSPPTPAETRLAPELALVLKLTLLPASAEDLTRAARLAEQV
jgi:hypothetical protein